MTPLLLYVYTFCERKTVSYNYIITPHADKINGTYSHALYQV